MSTISPNVDFVGHFAGMLAGFLLAVILADMQEEHQPPWYNKAKFTATGHDFFWRSSEQIHGCSMEVSYLPETNELPLKMDGWNTTYYFPIAEAYFQWRTVSFREGFFISEAVSIS